MEQTFIIIPGHETSKSPARVKKSGWEELLKETFPDSDVLVHFSNYDMFDRQQVSTATDSLVEMIQTTQGEILLFGYSFGGLLVRLAYGRLSSVDQSRVRAVITMGTPYHVPNRKQRMIVESLGLTDMAKVKPFLAITSYIDPHAHPVFTYPKGDFVRIKHFFFAPHNAFYFMKPYRMKVLKMMQTFLNEVDEMVKATK